MREIWKAKGMDVGAARSAQFIAPLQPVLLFNPESSSSFSLFEWHWPLVGRARGMCAGVAAQRARQHTFPLKQGAALRI